MLASRYPASEAGAVNQVAFLQNGRVELHAPTSALEELGLPLSHRSVETLAGMMAVRREAARHTSAKADATERSASA